MVNPCIVAPGPVTLKAGEPLRLRYRLVDPRRTAARRVADSTLQQWRGDDLIAVTQIRPDASPVECEGAMP